ncbi:MAG TPA: hypothetical protein K8V00_01670 [Ligilactobacillus acidipiscis]|uniref:Uncharacterized protein n=1 Tax=Ligilactobacillus acidipiscis TaxID=89059 RepID=A0A921F792_9LACO|nr:hypothetical protein [Ligilactobacillus acidipiscis]
MTNVLDRYLNIQGVTRYEISKRGKVSASTLQSAVAAFDKAGMQAKVAVKTITAIAEAVNRTPGQVLDGIQDVISKGDKTMIVNIEFNSGSKPYQTTIQFEHLNDDNVEYIGGREVSTAMVDIFNGNDIDKDLVSNYESYYTENDIQDAEHIKSWFLDQIKYEYTNSEIAEINLEEE